MKLTKDYTNVEIKAAPGDEGIVDMYVSMFGNVDLVGDRVVKGAFAKSLENFKTNDTPIPMIWNHQWEDPNAHIGKVLDAEETDEGLRVKAQIDIDQPFAAQVFRLLKERRVKEASFAYDVVREKKSSDGANELLELNLIEVGPTLKGANPETRLITAKAEEIEHELKTGRVISTKNENTLKQARDLLDEVLSQLSNEEAPAKATAKAQLADEQQPMSPPSSHENELKRLALDLMASAIERNIS